MTSKEEKDKMVEILISESGDLQIVLRPQLPFLVEGFRVLGRDIELFGFGEKVSIPCPEGSVDEVNDVDQAIVIEFERNGAGPVRETDVLRS